jgi:hypothetical protein
MASRLPEILPASRTMACPGAYSRGGILAGCPFLSLHSAKKASSPRTYSRATFRRTVTGKWSLPHIVRQHDRPHLATGPRQPPTAETPQLEVLLDIRVHQLHRLLAQPVQRPRLRGVVRRQAARGGDRARGGVRKRGGAVFERPARTTIGKGTPVGAGWDILPIAAAPPGVTPCRPMPQQPDDLQGGRGRHRAPAHPTIEDAPALSRAGFGWAFP